MKKILSSGLLVVEKAFESKFPIKDGGRGGDIEWERERETSLAELQPEIQKKKIGRTVLRRWLENNSKLIDRGLKTPGTYTFAT